jgi:paraquat-inducible protein B
MVGGPGDKKDSDMSDTTRTAVSEPLLSGTSSPDNPKRVVVSPDQLLRALADKLQQAAEKAVATAAASQLETRVNDAVAAIENAGKASIREIEEHGAQYRDKLLASAGDEVRGRLQADLAPAEQRIQEQLASLAQAQETAQTLQQSASDVRLVLAEATDFLRGTARELQDQCAAQLRETAAQASAEARQSFETSLTSLAAETRANWETRQSATLDELAHASDQQIDSFRRQLEAIVDSVATAMSAASERSRVQLDSFAKDATQQLRDAARGPAAS